MALEAADLVERIRTLFEIIITVYTKIKGINVNGKLKQLRFNTTKKYYQTYSDRHGQVQILGMLKPIPLDAIYSGIRMLNTESMNSYESKAELKKSDRSRSNGIDVANEHKRLIVLGDPGIGKSTFLRKVGLEALKGEQGSYSHEKIPVFLELKRLTSPDLDLEAEIAAEFESCGFPSPEGFTTKALNKGQLLLLFDGLDEVPPDNLNIVIQKIQDLVDRYSDNRFIASCRIAAYHTYFNRVNIVEITEFDDDQIGKFITNWFSSDLIQKNQTAQQCWELLQKRENKGAKELAQSPLLLTFLCMVHSKSLTVPSSRTTLYKAALNILLKEWASEKRVDLAQLYEGFHVDLEKKLLAKIAYDSFKKYQSILSKEQLREQIIHFLGDTFGAPPTLNASAVLKAIEVQQGILVKRDTDAYSFSHSTLQEYLCAEYINERSLQEKLVKNHAADKHWREVFFLVMELMDRDAVELLEKLEVQTKELSEHPKLKELLVWAETKTTHSANDYSGEIKRICALILILDLASNLAGKVELASDLNITIFCARKLASTLKLDRAIELTSNRAITRAIELASINNLEFASNLASNLELNRAIELANELTNNNLEFASNLELDRAIELAQFALDNQLIADIDLQSLISYLKNSSDSSTVSRKKFTSIISKSLDISPEFLDLSSDDVQVITNYLSTCKLMIDCSKQASGISAQQWEAIKQRMFLPKPAE